MPDCCISHRLLRSEVPLFLQNHECSLRNLAEHVGGCLQARHLKAPSAPPSRLHSGEFWWKSPFTRTHTHTLHEYWCSNLLALLTCHKATCCTSHHQQRGFNGIMLVWIVAKVFKSLSPRSWMQMRVLGDGERRARTASAATSQCREESSGLPKKRTVAG